MESALNRLWSEEENKHIYKIVTDAVWQTEHWESFTLDGEINI